MLVVRGFVFRWLLVFGGCWLFFGFSGSVGINVTQYDICY